MHQRPGLGFLPMVAPVVAGTAKSAILGKAVAGIGGLFGDTALDKQRKAEVAGALSRALDGDVTGVSYLLARAGIRPDANVKVAPSSIQHLFRTALRTYYPAVGIVPDVDIQKALGWSPPKPPSNPSAADVAMLVQSVPGGSVPVGKGTASGAAPTTVPQWVAPALAVGAVVLIFTLSRGGRR